MSYSSQNLLLEIIPFRGRFQPQALNYVRQVRGTTKFGWLASSLEISLVVSQYDAAKICVPLNFVWPNKEFVIIMGHSALLVKY